MSDFPQGLILAARPADDELSLLSGSPAPQVLPVANTPLIGYSLRAMHASGVRRVTIAVSAITSETVRGAVEGLCAEGPLEALEVSYLSCAEPPSLPECLAGARARVAGAWVVAQLGDSLSLGTALPERIPPGGEFDVTVLVRRSSPSQRRDGAGLQRRRHLRLVTEPSVPSSDQALAGTFVFGPGAPEVAARLVAEAAETPGISDLLSALAARGGEVEVRLVSDAWKYTGDADGLLAANRMVLDAIEPDLADADLSGARVEGRARIHPTAVLERTTIRGPAVVGPNAVLLDTFVGPYTSVGENVRVEGAELEYSIVFPNASIRHPGSRLEASLIGRGTRISRDFSLPAALKLRVGSRSEISLS